MNAAVEVFENVPALEEAAAGFIASRAGAALQARGRFVLCLSGGGTPRGVYRRLAAPPCSNRVDWTRVHLCFGDERMVPPEASESNYGMASAALLSRVPVPPQNVHRIHGELAAAEAEREYSVQLSGLLHGGSGRIDLVLLGVGEDGHTASLFPGSEVLDETEAMVRATYVPRLRAWRVTLTRLVLNNARDIVFLATGEGKAAIVQRVLTARDPDRALPATMVRPADGNVRWMLDRSAAAALGKEFLLPPAGRTFVDDRERT